MLRLPARRPDGCASLLELCNVQGTFGTITPFDVFRVFLSDRCSVPRSRSWRRSADRAECLQTAYCPLQQQHARRHGGLYTCTEHRAKARAVHCCPRSWLCRDTAMADSNTCIACSWLPRNQPVKRRIEHAADRVPTTTLPT